MLTRLARVGFGVLAWCAAAQQASGQTAPDVAARVGDREVTIAELDQEWRRRDPVSLASTVQALYDGRNESLKRLVGDLLIQQAADTRRVPVDSYLSDELGRRTRPVTDTAIESFYAENKANMNGRSLADMRELIRTFLHAQQRDEARDALVAELKKTGPAIRVSLEPPRRQIAVLPEDPSRGSPEAPVTIIEYSDYQCPFCARVEPTLARLREAYGDQVRIVWRDFPLTQIHPDAVTAAAAAHCAGEQGKYWEFHDRLFANQKALKPDALRQHAVAVGIEAEGFDACLQDGRYEQRVRDGIASGADLGVASTPTMFINGRIVTGAQPYGTFVEIVEDELERAKVR